MPVMSSTLTQNPPEATTSPRVKAKSLTMVYKAHMICPWSSLASSTTTVTHADATLAPLLLLEGTSHTNHRAFAPVSSSAAEELTLLPLHIFTKCHPQQDLPQPSDGKFQWPQHYLPISLLHFSSTELFML